MDVFPSKRITIKELLKLKVIKDLENFNPNDLDETYEDDFDSADSENYEEDFESCDSDEDDDC